MAIFPAMGAFSQKSPFPYFELDRGGTPEVKCRRIAQDSDMARMLLSFLRGARQIV